MSELISGEYIEQEGQPRAADLLRQVQQAFQSVHVSELGKGEQGKTTYDQIQHVTVGDNEKLTLTTTLPNDYTITKYKSGPLSVLFGTYGNEKNVKVKNHGPTTYSFKHEYFDEKDTRHQDRFEFTQTQLRKGSASIMLKADEERWSMQDADNSWPTSFGGIPSAEIPTRLSAALAKIPKIATR